MATDVVRFVAEEIAADGPEGTNLARINAFIDGYEAQPSAGPQLVDEDLRSYIISALTQLPHINPGRFLAARKHSAQAKGKRKQKAGEEDEGAAEQGGVKSARYAGKTAEEEGIDHVEVDERDRGLDLAALCNKYGTHFRLVADEATIAAVSKGNGRSMTPASYQLLLFAMRKRETGVSFTEIGEKFKYNASGTFFLAKILCDTGLAIKFRANNGKGVVSWIVAKRYAHLCKQLPTSLRQASAAGQEEEEQGEEEGQDVEEADEGETQLEEMSKAAVGELIRKGKNKELDEQGEGEKDIDEGEEGPAGEQEDGGSLTTLHGLLAYPSLRNRKQEAVVLTDRALARMRILKLLMASKNHATIRADLIIRIGIPHPDKMQKKVFNALLRQMEAEDLIQRCLLKRPLHHQLDHTEHCWMATAKGIEYHGQLMSNSQQRETRLMRLKLNREIESSQSKLCVEPSFGRQLLEKVDGYGAGGITIDYLNVDIGGNKDRKRDLDHMLAGLKKDGNRHYQDFTLFSGLEQSGRTRSQRFWTRRWRPDRLAPQESRNIDASLLDSWTALPHEQSFATVEEWQRQHLAAGKKSKPKAAAKTVMKKEQHNSDGSEEEPSDGKKRAKKRARGANSQARVESNDQEGAAVSPVKLGRPRKNFDKKAERLAKKYMLQREAERREREETSRVEDLVGEERGDGGGEEQGGEASVSRGAEEESVAQPSERKVDSTESPKIGRPRKHFTASAQRTADRYREQKLARERERREKRRAEGLPSDEEEEPKKKVRGIVRQLPSAKATPTAMTVEQNEALVLDPALSSVQDEGASANGSPATIKRYYSPRARDKKQEMNLTVQVKYETIQHFFRETQVFESTLFDAEYRKFVRRSVGANGNVQQFEMDRKLRSKLLSSLERAGEIKTTRVAAPVLSKGSQRTIWSWVGIEESKLIDYCRQVSEGTNMPARLHGLDTAIGRRILDPDQIDAPESFFQQVGNNFDYDVKTLEEFLKKERNRREMLKYGTIRAQYTGRLPGLGARLSYLHKTVVGVLQRGGGEGERVMDLSWWAREASLGQYLKLAMPPTDDVVLQASQDAEVTAMAVKDISRPIQASLDLGEGGLGCYKTLKPLLDLFALFDLAHPDVVDGEGRGEEMAGQGGHLVYRFASHGRKLGWINSTEAKEAEHPSDFFSQPSSLDQYWQRVMECCVQAQPMEDGGAEGMDATVAGLLGTLRKKSAWYHNYHLLRPQQAFLFKTISLGLGKDVLSDEGLLQQISQASLTPVWILCRYYERRFKATAAVKMQDAVKAAEQKAVSGHPFLPDGLTTRQANAIKKKARLALAERLARFDETIRAYLADSSLDEAAQTVILEGLSNVRREYGRGEAGLSMKRVRQMFEDVSRAHQSGQSSWSVIVNRKRPSRGAGPKGGAVAKGSGVGTDKGDEKERPRARKATIGWTKATDELLRDAVVILRCRDRHRNPLNPRKNWGALDQIFPAISPGSRHQHFEQLRQAVGEEAYLNQLEVEWNKLWTKFRGTDRLVDPNPNDPSDFDLMEHVTFLRTHIDKLAVAEKVDNETGEPLPLESSKLVEIYDYERPPHLGYDPASTLARFAMADVSGEDKSRLLRKHPFTLASGAMGTFSSLDYQGKRAARRERGVAMGLVKMVLCTAEADYNEEAATRFCLDNSSEEAMGKALMEMQEMKVIKRKGKEGRQLPNRNFTFADEYVQFLEDTLETLPFWHIASALQSVLQSRQVRVFGDNEDAEVAAALTLLSHDRVEASVDLDRVERIKMDKLFNAKNLHDDQLELPIECTVRGSTKLEEGLVERWTEVLQSGGPVQDAVLLWLNDGSGAANLSNRVEQRWEQWSATLSRERYVDAMQVKATIDDAGADGIAKEDLAVRCPSRHLPSLVASLVSISPPLLFSSGYDDCSRLVSSRFLRHWTVGIPLNDDNGWSFVFPHKWYDIHGRCIPAVWTQSLQLLIHAILSRPGVSRSQLLSQFRLALDRSELMTLIDFACRSGVITKLLSRNESVRGQEAEWEAQNDREIAYMARE